MSTHSKLQVPRLMTLSNTILRNCFRCGLDFRCEGNERLCQTCAVFAQIQTKPDKDKINYREQQIITLVAEGKLNKEIGYKLHLSEGTIKEYLCKIFKKVGVTNRTELAIWSHKQKNLVV